MRHTTRGVPSSLITTAPLFVSYVPQANLCCIVAFALPSETQTPYRTGDAYNPSSGMITYMTKNDHAEHTVKIESWIRQMG